MARLIDADKMRGDWLEYGENEYVYDTNAVLESIDAQPTVDAVEVVYGRWEAVMEYEDFQYAHCSVCGKRSEYMTNFCGNCGAYMRERRTDG